MEAIIRKKTRRSLEGKKSEFRIRDSEVSEKKIIRYRKTKHLSDEQALRLRATTPPELICYTPPMSPLTTPRVLETPERILKWVQDYIKGSFDSKFWQNGKDEIYSSKFNTTGPLMAFSSQCYLACNLFHDGDFMRGGQMLNMAMGHVKQMLSDGHPHFLDLFIRTMSPWTRTKLGFLAYIIIRHFSDMSAIVMGQRHPVHQIFSHLMGLNEPRLMHILTLVQDIQIDSQTSGPFSQTTVRLKHSKVFWDSRFRSRNNTEGCLTLLHEVEHALGTSHTQSQAVRAELCWQYFGEDRFDEAAALAQYIIAIAADNHQFIISEAFYVLAMAKFKLSEMDLAEHYIRQAVNINISTHGMEDNRALRYMITLKFWLQQWNRVDEAAEVHRQWEEVVDTKHARFAEEEEKCFQRCLASRMTLDN